MRAGRVLFLVESMKMHHEVVAPEAGRVDEVLVDDRHGGDAGRRPGPAGRGRAVRRDVDRHGGGARSIGRAVGRARPTWPRSSSDIGSGSTRPARRPSRSGAPSAVARHGRTSPTSSTTGSFVEYGPLVIAAQRRRRDLDDLIANTPADGMIGGLGTVNGDRFDGHAARVVAMSYDYTVLAGTQGTKNHDKKDRLFELAERMRLPIVFFTEGGGGRPGDTDDAGDQRSRLPRVPLVRPALRPGPARRRQRRLLLRRQRGDPRLLRRRHRHRGLEHRHGRPGDDRGRRSRRVRADGDRPDRGAAGQRRGRHRRRRRGRGRARRQAVPVVLPGRRSASWDVRRPGAAAPRRAAETASAPTTSGAAVELLFDTGSVLELRRGLRGRHDHRAGPDRGTSGGRDRQQPGAPRRRHRQRRRRQGAPASCSSATPSTSRSSRSATRRG